MMKALDHGCREIEPEAFDDVIGYDNFILVEFFTGRSLLLDEIEDLEEQFEVFELYIFCVDANKHKSFAATLGVTTTPSAALFYSEEHFPRSITTQFDDMSHWLETNLPEVDTYTDPET